MKATLPTTVTLPVADIQPYWRNPRRIPEAAVDAVAESIRLYGYQQPIVVDTDHVVIVGHTRLAAVQKLGLTEVPVYVSDLPANQAKEYRLVDNKTGEMTDWDHDSLVLELREWEDGLLATFFPDLDLEIATVTDAMGTVTQDDVDLATANVTRIEDRPPVPTTDVVCPACFHTFTVRTDSLPGLSRTDLTEIAARGQAQ